MGKLINCTTCKQQIAREARVCPHCGAKNKKKSGCGTMLIIMVVVFFFCIYAGMTGNSTSVPHQEESGVAFTTKAKETPKPAVKFDKTEMWTMAQIYAEKRINPKTKMKWIGNRKVEKLRKFQQFKGQIYAVEQEFTILNLYNVEVKHQARVIMEYLPDKGYRGVWLTVDGKAWQ